MKNVMELAVHEVRVVTKSGDGTPLTVGVTVGPDTLGMYFTTSVKKAPRVGDIVRMTYEWGEAE
jgi:hypothetical protein